MICICSLPINKWALKGSCPRGKSRVLTEVWILGKVLKFVQQFSRAGKSLKNRDKVWKIVKLKSWGFFQSYSKCFISEIFFIVVKFYSILPIHNFAVHRKRAFFLHVLRSVLITYLITSSLEKEIVIVLEKSLENVVNFGSKIFMNLLI